MKKYKVTGSITCIVQGYTYAKNEDEAYREYLWDLDDIGDCIDQFIERVEEVKE